MDIKYSERMDYFGTSMIRELFKLLGKSDNMISFAAGEPATDLYPLQEYKEAANIAIEKYGVAALSYDTTDGFMPLREIITNERMKAVGVDTKAGNILITNGSQQGIDFSARLFLDKDDVVICEGPTYLAALNTFNSCGPKIIQIPMDEDGMQVDLVEETIKANKNTKFIYTIPDFQNPTGITMSLERRRKLLAVAEKYNVPIVEDNPYVDLRFTGEKVPAIKSLDTKGLVIYLGSFSKICVPGARIGWICASDEIIGQYNKIKQAADLQASTITQREITTYMQLNSMEEHIKTITPVYKKRRDAMINAIEREFPAWAKCTNPEGGIFTWVTLPEGMDAMEVFRKAIAEENVAFVPGNPFFADDNHKNYMRLSYAKMNEEVIEEGIKRLARVVKSFEQ